MMELLHCQHCDSNLVNLVSLKINHNLHEERNINIKDNTITIENLNCVNQYYRCFSCGKLNELVLKNEKGCCMIKHNKIENNNISLHNKIISQQIF